MLKNGNPKYYDAKDLSGRLLRGFGGPFGSHFYVQGLEFFNWLLGSAQFFEGRSPRKMLNNRNPQYYDAKVEGCCRAWGVLLGAISMYKGWSFSTGCLGARNFLKVGALAKC